MGIVVSSERLAHWKDLSIYRDDGSCQHVSCEQVITSREECPVDDDSVYIDVNFALHKARDDEQLVSGWANVAINKDGSVPLDWQDDVIAPETLEKAAINFMMDYRGSGEMHKGDSKGVVVESIVFTKEKQQAIGIPEGTVPEGWFITVKVNDPDVFAKVKDGTYRMFSIQGTAKRVKL
jgi:hypothetical protein